MLRRRTDAGGEERGEERGAQFETRDDFSCQSIREKQKQKGQVECRAGDLRRLRKWKQKGE